MKLQSNREFSVGTRVLCTILVWQSFTQAVYDDQASYLRRANLTTTATSYNQCDIKCVTSVETGHQSGCLGYAGDDCSFPYEICPDSKTQCFGEYAVCVDVTTSGTSNNDARNYKCECRAPSTNEPYAEMMQDSRIEDCRSRVTEICEKDQTASSYAFCTNGGQCVAEVEEGEPHPGCFCPGRFVGRHCEKRRGTGREYRVEPPIQVDESNELHNQQNGNEIENRRIGNSTGIFVIVGSSALSAFLIYSVVAYKRFLAQREAPPLEDGSGKTDLSIHVPPGGNDNVSALEMH